MKKLIFLLIGSISISLSAQSIDQLGINSGGTYVYTATDTVGFSYSIGEAVVTPFNMGGNAGFQQAWLANLSLTATTDSVWPGDANDDGIANNVDLLAIGLGFGTMGPGRPNASLAWVAQPALPWPQTLPTANYKHIDCDGNSLIAAEDTLAIQQNYGLTHAQKTQRTVGTPLLLRWEDNAPEIGDTLRGEILFGTDTLPVSDGYGLAFSLDIDTVLFSLSSLRISYSGNWLGQLGSDAISLTRILPQVQRADLALTRTDQESNDGFGMIASFTIIMIDDLAGKQDSLLQAISLQDAVAVEEDGTEIPVLPESEPLRIRTGPNGLPALPEGLSLYPNPATTFSTLTTPTHWQGNWTMRDVEGRELRVGPLSSLPTKLSVTDLPAGMYFIEIRSRTEPFTLPLQVRK